MTTSTAEAADLPDIASRQHVQPQGVLDWVGMSNVHMPLQVSDEGVTQAVSSSAQIYVNLEDPQAKGIHMSRLYLLLDTHAGSQLLTPATMADLLGGVLDTHTGLSSKAFVQFDFEYLLRQPALLSENAGWSSYPISLKGTLIGRKLQVELGLTVR